MDLAGSETLILSTKATTDLLSSGILIELMAWKGSPKDLTKDATRSTARAVASADFDREISLRRSSFS
jgi:hypothetical protein